MLTLKRLQNSQRETESCLNLVSKMVHPGISEIEVAKLIEIEFKAHGVKSFFHKPFVWFGERTKFEDILKYSDFLPTNRILKEGEVFILDAAPIVDGVMCDVGLSFCAGENIEFEKAKRFLKELRAKIPQMFIDKKHGADISHEIKKQMIDHHYTICHDQYPFEVLAHRVYEMNETFSKWSFMRFSLMSAVKLFTNGFVSEIINDRTDPDLKGFWAIEPHLGTVDFGAKFEEIIFFDGKNAHWIADMGETNYASTAAI